MQLVNMSSQPCRNIERAWPISSNGLPFHPRSMTAAHGKLNRRHDTVLLPSNGRFEETCDYGLLPITEILRCIDPHAVSFLNLLDITSGPMTLRSSSYSWKASYGGVESI